jgi:anti-sigma factor RsiW
LIDDIADWDAAYVLGSLSRDDRRLYEAYLAENPGRAAGLTELAGLPGILNLLDCDEALALAGQADGSIADVLALDLMPSLASAAAMQPTLKGGINAALAVTEKTWGTRLDGTCDYVEDWAKAAPAYDIVVTTVEGVESAVGTWTPASDHAGGLAASTAIPTSTIHTVDIRVRGTHEPLAITTMR